MVDSAWVALSLTRHLGGKTIAALLQHFDDNVAAILDADEDTLREVPRIGAKIAESIRQIDIDAVKRKIDDWQQAGVHIVTRNDDEYPLALRSIDDAPPTLFVRGNLPDMSDVTAYAVVGTRTPSDPSFDTALQISKKLTQMGHIVVSGLALGVDYTAHVGAVNVAEGKTVAVLGSGVLNVYPPENDKLAKDIMRKGVIMCEVAPDAVVSVAGLVARNRIISAMCVGVIVVESQIDGGAMHAVRFAKKQGKRIYAVDNDASGNRQLLADGAKAISADLYELEPV